MTWDKCERCGTLVMYAPVVFGGETFREWWESAGRTTAEDHDVLIVHTADRCTAARREAMG
jgi:hypothetical protein